MAKSLFKKCPSCKFEKCWAQAPKCESCGFDFKLGRKPRTKPIEISDDEDDFIPPIVEEKPLTTTKVCPDCKFTCWHAAPFCEKCEYNFRTGESRLQAARKRRGDDGDSESEGGGWMRKLEVRSPLGVKPVWRNFLATLNPRPTWLDDYNGGEKELRHWASTFLRELRHLLTPHSVHPGCIVDYVECYTMNELLRKAIWQLQEWYGLKSGISEWRDYPNDPRIMTGEILTPTEMTTEYRKMSAHDRVAVHLLHPHGVVWMATADEAEHFRVKRQEEGQAFVFVAHAPGARSLRPLPANWSSLKESQRAMVLSSFCGTPESIPEVKPIKTSRKKAKV